MKLKTFAIFIFTLIVLGACTADLNEVVDSTYPDGSNKVVKYYENEADTQILIKEVGYYPDGKKQYEGGIDKDKRHGKWTYWYKNGNVRAKAHLITGLMMDCEQLTMKMGRFITKANTMTEKE